MCLNFILLELWEWNGKVIEVGFMGLDVMLNKNIVCFVMFVCDLYYNLSIVWTVSLVTKDKAFASAWNQFIIIAINILLRWFQSEANALSSVTEFIFCLY